MWKLTNLVLTNWRVLAVSAVSVALFSGGWLTNGWRLHARLEAQKAEYAEANSKGWKAALEQYQRLQQEYDQAAREADRAIQRMRIERDRWKTAFNQAKTDDPDCAAWASGAIRCPVPQS
jgi:hypothetical protein